MSVLRHAPAIALLLSLTHFATARERARMPQAPAAPPPSHCSAEPEWDDPAPPRRIFGNSWYVGTCGITSILIASPRGHVLIDGGTERGGELIEANLRALGVRLQDIRYILVSHEHMDHVGGVAQLQRDSGATVITREPAVTALKSGMSDRRDPQFTSVKPFPAISAVQAIRPNGVVRAGGPIIRNLPMPGHTPGGSGWTWRECQGSVCANIVYSDSVSAISDKVYRYAAKGALAGAMTHTLAMLERLPCDILLTTHSNADTFRRLEGKAALIDSSACKALAQRGREGLAQRLADERNGTKP